MIYKGKEIVFYKFKTGKGDRFYSYFKKPDGSISSYAAIYLETVKKWWQKNIDAKTAIVPALMPKNVLETHKKNGVYLYIVDDEGLETQQLSPVTKKLVSPEPLPLPEPLPPPELLPPPETVPPKAKETSFWSKIEELFKLLKIPQLRIPKIAAFAADMDKLNTQDQIKALKKEMFTASKSEKAQIRKEINQILQAHSKRMQQLRQGTFEDDSCRSCEREVFGDELI